MKREQHNFRHVLLMKPTERFVSIAGNAHSFLFPSTPASPPLCRIAHIPQTFGQHNVAFAPSHLRKPSAKRLVRLPDSDDEFGLKPADSFGFSDDEDGSLAFSSEEEMGSSQGVDDGRREAIGEICWRDTVAQRSSYKVDGKPVRSDLGSSRELDFSDDERDDAVRGWRDADDIQFSSSSE